jgi:hypothetical protein
MTRILTVLVVGTILLGASAPIATAADEWNSECRGYSPAKTVECAADKQQSPGGASGALRVWGCESNFGTEPPHSDPYHGPFQYTYGTYASQRASMPDVTKWFELSTEVHDMRSNIITAVAWAARNGWGPWPNCGLLA